MKVLIPYIKIDNTSSFPIEKIFDIINFLDIPLNGDVELVIKSPEDEDKTDSAEQADKCPSDTWDGSCWPEDRLIEIILPEQFPADWVINVELEEFYQNNITFNDLEEFALFIISHELYHIYFFDYPDYRMFNWKFTKVFNKNKDFFDEESECDLFALLKLNQWRRNKNTDNS